MDKHNLHAKERNFDVGDWVFVKNYSQGQWNCVKKKRPVSAHVQLPNGQPRHCHFEKWARSIEITLAIEDNDLKNAIPNEYK